MTGSDKQTILLGYEINYSRKKSIVPAPEVETFCLQTNLDRFIVEETFFAKNAENKVPSTCTINSKNMS